MIFKRNGVRLCVKCSLIFFSLLLLTGCWDKRPEEIKVIWKNQQATGITLPISLLGEDRDSLEKRVSVRQIHGQNSILGNYTFNVEEVVFEPLVPFTRGLQYEVLIDDRVVKQIPIPLLDSGDPPRLLNIYPTSDTLPENLLKIYIQFSRPMREGNSVRYLTLLKNNKDTLPGIFLDLQPELWNSDRTLLTLWLDPGRIKRGLHPNQQLGVPLRRGEFYKLIVSNQWRDIQGDTVATPYAKKFVVTVRDSLSPDPKAWIIHAPKPDTNNVLDIELQSPLDYSLLCNTLHVVNENEKSVSGKWQIGNRERTASFTPDDVWQTGDYTLLVETRLEDLAGNNLNRPFDRHINTNSEKASDAKSISLRFKVDDHAR